MKHLLNRVCADALKTTQPIELGSVGSLEPEFVGIENAAKFLGCGRTSVFTLLKTGRLKGVKLRIMGNVSGRRLVSVASLRKLLTEAEAQG